MPEAQKALEPCRERGEILESIRAVVEQILHLHQLEIEAVSKSDIEELDRLDRELKKAMEFERSLFERFTAHTKSHGCQPG